MRQHTRKMHHQLFSNQMILAVVVPAFLAVAVVSSALTTSIDATTDACWNSDQECVIQATLFHTAQKEQDGLPVVINCLVSTLESNLSSDVEETQNAYQLPHFERTQGVTLDGCHTSLRAISYGFEFLPNCDKIVQVNVQRFNADVLQQFQCSRSPNGIQAEVVRFKNNEIGTVAANSFTNLIHLRELYFVGNSLRHIERTAFDALNVVEMVHIEEEPLLALKEADMLERSGAAYIHLIGLKRVTSQLFAHLPETLREIQIVHTVIDGDAAVVTNPRLLRNISIVGCALNSFILLDCYASVVHVNLSGNAIMDFHIETAIGNADNNTTDNHKNSQPLESAVETLDLSENKLTQLPIAWLSKLSKLRHIVLSGNCIKTFSLPKLLSATLSAELIDLRENQLVALHETELEFNCDHTRIRIDRNPWNCMWLLELAHTYPEKFRIFQYEKFISKVNVNGLECNPAERSNSLISHAPQHAVERGGANLHNDSTHLNISTFNLIYGSPWDIKRNQRAEALVIVFMLPVGVAFLFFILYMWIRCQKVFHWSYYRTFPVCMGRQTGGGIASRSAERFDVVRHIPPTSTTFVHTDDDYETPLNGITSACNCNNINSANPNEKCHKPHHITYESLPIEQAYKIYEEIIEENIDDNGPPVDMRHVHPFYDHLTFEQPTDQVFEQPAAASSSCSSSSSPIEECCGQSI